MENGEREEGDSGAPAVDRGDNAGGGSSGAPPRAPVMQWESFLPRRSLRVLLVEGDDSTRHIVTALLRKCNYSVAGVADGMKAWEVLKEKSYWFDLVLTEVATPSLSGIGLLTKIMGAEECKNIPVIVMSTHESVNVVLKCMLKGAVDFLVKPVRKNELRNLWQHVWRRHCMNASDNNTGSNQISANVGGRSKTGENSDERRDAQSSGSKRDIEIESTQKHEEPPQVEDRRTSEGEANLDSSDKDAAIRTSVSLMDYGENTKDDNLVGIRVDITLPLQEACVHNVTQERNRSHNISSGAEETLDLVRPAEGNNDDTKSYCQNNPPNESEQNMNIFVEPISNGQCSYAVLKKDARVEDELCEAAKSSHVSEASNIVTSPLWELSLRRPQPNGCVQPDLKEKHVLKQSVASAFSRLIQKLHHKRQYCKDIWFGEKRIHSSFKTVSSDVCIRTRKCVENCHLLINRHGTDNEKNTPFCHIETSLVSPRGNEDETTVYFQASSTNKENAILPSPPTENDCAGHSSAVEDTALHRPQFGFIPLPIPVGAIRPIPYQSLCAGFGGIVQPVFYPETSLAPQGSAAIEKPLTQIPSSDHSAHHNNNLINNSSSLDFHHREVTDHPRHWRQAINISELGDSRELCYHMEQGYQSGSCNQDVLKSSGSNGSDETPDGARNTNALESGNESSVQNFNRKALDCDRSRREAALIKFRMKRKDRCFEKKVRYYSRKKLAEQQPRIKGQFVRQKISDSMTTAGDS